MSLRQLLAPIQRLFGSTTVDVTPQIVAAARQAVANKTFYIYDEVRPAQFYVPTATRKIKNDCEMTLTLFFWIAGAPDPNGYGYNGEGFTGTLLARGQRITKAQAGPGDVIVYGPGTGVHCALIVEGGADPLTVSHGWSGEPAFVNVSKGAPDGTNGVETYLRFPRTKIVPPTPPPAPPSATASAWAAKNGLVQIDVAEAKLAVAKGISWYVWNAKAKPPMVGSRSAVIPTNATLWGNNASLTRAGIPHAGA